MFKFYLILILNLILRNIYLPLLLVATYYSYKYAETFPDNVKKIPILAEIFIPSEGWAYMYKNGDIISVKITEEPVEVLDGIGIFYEYSNYNVLMWFLFALSILAIIILFGIFKFQYKDSFRHAMFWSVKKTEEGDMIYWRVGNRLILRTKGEDDRISLNRVVSITNVDSIPELLNSPIFETKSEKRDKVITKIVK